MMQKFGLSVPSAVLATTVDGTDKTGEKTTKIANGTNRTGNKIDKTGENTIQTAGETDKTGEKTANSCFV